MTFMAQPGAAHSLLRAVTSPLHCLQGVYVGLRSLCVALCHFVFVYVQFVLVCVGLCSVCVGLCWLFASLESLCERTPVILASARLK